MYIEQSKREMTCCIFGRRDLKPMDEVRAEVRLSQRVPRLVYLGMKYFGVGVGTGFESTALKYLLAFRGTPPGQMIKIIAVCPCTDWEKTVPDPLKRGELMNLCEHCDKTVYTGEEYNPDMYLVRNGHLIDSSGTLITYCNRTGDGTACSARYAYSQGLEVLNCSSWDVRQLARSRENRGPVPLYPDWLA